MTLSEDSSVRLISPVSGTVITSIPAPPQLDPLSFASAQQSLLAKLSDKNAQLSAASQVVDVVFSSLTDRVYCLMQDGVIRVHSAAVNPCEEVAVWPAAPSGQRTISLCIAEFQFEEQKVGHGRVFFLCVYLCLHFLICVGSPNVGSPFMIFCRFHSFHRSHKAHFTFRCRWEWMVPPTRGQVL